MHSAKIEILIQLNRNALLLIGSTIFSLGTFVDRFGTCKCRPL